MSLTSVVSGAGFAAGIVGPLHVTVWDTAVGVAHARMASDLLAKLGRNEDRVLVMAVLGPNTPPPDSVVREIFATEFGRLGPRVVAVANVIEGQGFRAAAMRAVVTGLTLVIRAAHPQKACSTIDEGSHFLADLSDGRLTPSAITRAVFQLRSASASTM